VPNNGNEVAVAACLAAEGAESSHGIVERHPLDGAGDYLSVGLGGGGVRGHRRMIGYVSGEGDSRERCEAAQHAGQVC
jgi:hypothetical protein